MRKTTINFIKEADDGSRVCDFELLQYEVPKEQKEQGVSINQWSNAGRALFQRNYKSLANELGDGRKTNAEKAVNVALEFLNESALYASEKTTTAWSRLYCAVSLNHLLWLYSMDWNQQAVEKNTQEQAKVLIKAIKDKYNNVRCPPKTAWPIPRWCYKLLRVENKGKDKYQKESKPENEAIEYAISPSDLQCLLTAYVCVLARRNGMTDREKGGYDIPLVTLQDEARSMASTLLGLAYPRWTVYQRMFMPQDKHNKDILLRAAAMPVTTGLARTLIMVAMPLDAAAIVATDMLKNAWPLTVGGMNASYSGILAAQLLAGMGCTISDAPEKAIEKTCYVWTRYYW